MIESRETKLISRTELRSPSFSPDLVSADEGTKIQWQRQLDQVYQGDVDVEQDHGTSKPIVKPTQAIDEPDDGAYEFKLFASKHKQDPGSISQPTKIVLESPSPGLGEPGFVRSRRPEAYYFTGFRTKEQLGLYGEAAVEGEDVLKESRSRWACTKCNHEPHSSYLGLRPGFALPWRVITIKSPSYKPAVKTISEEETKGSSGRKRKGKKRRIAIRMRLQIKEECVEKAKLTEAEKEMLERERRNKRNREKKVRRREKARQQKKAEAEAPDATS
ncbi:MAG: hypothetical protein Q9181_002633 [Wetmoreana brouardii]